MTPKLGQVPKFELKESKKMKVLQLNEQTPKQHTNPNLTPKSAHKGPKKENMTPELSENQNLQLKKT